MLDVHIQHTAPYHDNCPREGVFHQSHEWLNGIEDGGSTTRLQDEAVPGDVHAALTERDKGKGESRDGAYRIANLHLILEWAFQLEPAYINLKIGNFYRRFD